MTNAAINDFRAASNASMNARENARDMIIAAKDIRDNYAKTFATSRTMLANDTIATMLVALNVDATRYESNQLNAIKKENYILRFIFNRNVALENYIREIFCDMFNAQKDDASAVYTKDDAKSSLRASKAMSESTINAQHKTTLDALMSLNMISLRSTATHKFAYSVNFENELTKLFAEKLLLSSSS